MSGHTIYLSHKQLDGSIVWNGMPTIQYSARSAAICTTVGLSYNVFFKSNDLHDSLHMYLQHEKGADTPYRRVPSEKSTEIVADTVANVIAALLSSYHFTSDPECYNATIRALAKAGERKDR